MDGLSFEWDDEKEIANVTKHRVSFGLASRIFSNETIQSIDDRENYGEIRWIAIGIVGLEIYRVVYTHRERMLLRLISAQKATRKERELYYGQILLQ